MRENMEMDQIKAPWQIAACERQAPVLLALSGGADSRFLLHVLAQFANRDGFPLLLAHVNHGIRGEASLRDRDFCISLAREYGLEIAVLDADVPALAQASGRGLEETAREVRYDYFAKLMRERGIPLLATAHNADDNAETVLFRMARGSGLLGLCGIAPVRPFGEGLLVRPMLEISKREILTCCERERLQFVTDDTNFDTSYARNRIRAEVLPVLESLFTGSAARISAMTSQLREDESLLAELAERFLHTHCRDGFCPARKLLDEPRALQGRILSLWLQRTAGITPERVHVDALLRLCEVGEAHSSLSLPQGVTVKLENGSLCIRDREDLSVGDYHIPFCEGKTALDGTDLSVYVEKCEKNRKVHNLSTAPYIFLRNEFDIMKGKMYWRPRRAGDRILMGGMHREVRRLYREAGLSLEMRTRLPMLCDDEGIVWIPYVGARDGAEAPNGAEDVFFVSLCKKETFAD